jgi:hypothetical protein
LSSWVEQHEIDHGKREEVSTAEAERICGLERKKAHLSLSAITSTQKQSVNLTSGFSEESLVCDSEAGQLGAAPLRRIQAIAVDVSRLPEKAIPTRSPLGRERRILLMMRLF